MELAKPTPAARNPKAEPMIPAKTMPTAVLLEPLHLRVNQDMPLSDMGARARDIAMRIGFVVASTAMHPARTGRKGFHCPGKRGLIPVCAENAYHAKERQDMLVTLLRKVNVRNAANPFLAKRSFKDKPSLLLSADRTFPQRDGKAEDRGEELALNSVDK